MKITQPDLPTVGDSRPRELLVSGVELDTTIGQLQMQGTQVEKLEPERGCTDLWRARLRWNEPAP